MRNMRNATREERQILIRENEYVIILSNAIATFEKRKKNNIIFLYLFEILCLEIYSVSQPFQIKLCILNYMKF